MNNGVTAFVAFVIGVAAGSVLTWKLLKTRYEQMAQEEIESVKETFSRAYKEEEQVKTENAEEILDNLGYNTETKEGDTMNEPYVISPDEFGEKDYTMVTLTYYNDRVLADRFDEVIDDPTELVGPEALESFGEYEDDAVYVRNDALKTDYEILLDVRDYSEMVGGE